MKNLMVYFEKFSLLSFLMGLAMAKLYAKSFRGVKVKFFYVDVTWLAGKVVVPLLRLCRVEINRLGFKMLDVKDGRGELIRIRIRSDLLGFQKRAMEGDAYKALCHGSWSQDQVEDYISKGLFDGSILDEESVARLIFILEVIAWHVRSNNYSEPTLIARNRPWFDLCRGYAQKHGIDLYKSNFFPCNIFRRSFFYENLVKYPGLYRVLKNLKYGQIFGDRGNGEKIVPKVYVEGRGDVNMENDGDHSDFFWQLNSGFPIKI